MQPGRLGLCADGWFVDSCSQDNSSRQVGQKLLSSNYCNEHLGVNVPGVGLATAQLAAACEVYPCIKCCLTSQVVYLSDTSSEAVLLLCVCRQRKGLVPILVIGSLILLFLFIAVVRAAASARGEQKGAVCFLSKLGVQIGHGCGGSLDRAGTPSKAVTAALSDLVEATPRVKDVAHTAAAGAVLEGASAQAVSGGAVAAGETGSSSSGARRLLWRSTSVLDSRWQAQRVRWRR